MPTAESADGVGHALEPIAATAQPLELPYRLQTMLVATQSNEGLIDRFLLGYRDHTRAAYLTWPTCETSAPGAHRPTSGC
jgi:hypothetical protein